MPRKSSIAIRLTPQDAQRFDRTTMVGTRRKIVRIDIVSRAARGQSNYMIAKELGISRNTVKKWRYRFAREGIDGLETRPIPGRPPMTEASRR